MNSRSIARLLAFALALVVLFGVGAAAGSLLDPDSPGSEAEPHAGGEQTGSTPSAAVHEEEAGDHSAEPATGGAGGEHGGADAVRGLSASANGLELEVDDPERTVGATEALRFRILAEDGSVVEDFDVAHEKRMHVIVARRDLTRFQHLHPRAGADGTWEVPLRLDDRGAYRLFADFSSGGETTTLAADLDAGDAEAEPLPEPRSRAVSDGGYDVRFESGGPKAGKPAELRFDVTRDGRPVEVQPYLGADGHLVALREGDLAFLHVHPIEGGTKDNGGTQAGEGHAHTPDSEHGTPPGDVRGRSGDPIAFKATFPTAGAYRLFLQFKIGSRVETVAFTEEVRP